ncbi:MAG: FHA domain-containing protein [Pseudomonadota bacterium]
MEIKTKVIPKDVFCTKVATTELFNSEPLAVACADIDGLMQKGDTCVLVTGEQGVGKSAMLDKLHPLLDQKLVTARASGGANNAAEFLSTILKSFGFQDFEGHTEEYRHILRAFIRHEATHSSKPVLIVDDADQIKPEVLFELCSLLGMQINGTKAVNLLLAGRPEVESALDCEELSLVWKSITVRSQFTGMGEMETADYVAHRLHTSGLHGDELFCDSVIPSIYRYTGGVPGLINRLCDSCLTALAKEEGDQVDEKVVKAAITELELTPRAVRSENERNKKVLADAAVGKDNAPRVVLSFEGRLLGVYTLDKERVTIGRHHFNEICIDSTAISRHHAQFLVNGKGVYLIDLNSTNGTFVNFKQVEQKLLRNSDIIAVGKHRLKFTEARNIRPADYSEQEQAKANAETMVLPVAGGSNQELPPIKRVK